MTCNLRQKLESLRASYASPCQTLTIIHTAIVPSLSYALAVTPWKNYVGSETPPTSIKEKETLWSEVQYVYPH